MEGDMADTSQDGKLKHELVGLFQYIQRVRQEIAAISRPADEENKFEKMGDQLDAIVEATESATNTIMSTVETNEGLLNGLKEGLDAEKIAIIDEISANNMGLFEACSFQDITGQRVSKVVKSLTYVEDRVTALIEAWGKDELEQVVVEINEKTDDEKLIHGPQRESEAISQSDIDALFD